uniref:Uncharacterized protein n=1 Tax=Micrurus corallinus TaxID=54390 RepID=A0A2D4GDI8_MICCO
MCLQVPIQAPAVSKGLPTNGAHEGLLLRRKRHRVSEGNRDRVRESVLPQVVFEKAFLSVAPLVPGDTCATGEALPTVWTFVGFLSRVGHLMGMKIEIQAETPPAIEA